MTTLKVPTPQTMKAHRLMKYQSMMRGRHLQMRRNRAYHKTMEESFFSQQPPTPPEEKPN